MPLTPGSRPEPARRRRVMRLIVPAFVLLATLFAAPIASADRAYSTRFSVNTTGAIISAANTLMTCPTAASGCTAAQAKGDDDTGNTALNNNNYNEVLVNQDSTSGLIDSSSSTLSIPTGATVLFAGLYWGADNTGGTAANDSKVSLKVPGATSYQSLTASQLDTSSQEATRYQGFVDVTSQVKAAGAGTYTVGGVAATTGEDHYAGWTIVVAYELDSAPARNLTIDDGFQSESASGGPLSFPVSGFETPPAGTVNTDLGFIAYEGDEGFVGDSASLDGHTLSDAAHPANNFFDSEIADDGVPVTSKSPNYVNQLGYDSSFINADGLLPNSATSATIQVTTNGDAYYPGVVTFASDLYAPKIDQTKTVTDITHPGGPVQEGDVLKYTISGTNDGQDGTSSFVLTDPVPGNSTYKTGTLNITNSGGATGTGNQTDASGDDLAEYTASSNQVTFRLGSGASATAGGDIAPGASYSVNFEVTVNGPATNALQPGAAVNNTATAKYNSLSLGVPLSTSSSANTTVAAPDLAITKTLTSGTSVTAGGTAAYSLVVDNKAGTAATQGTVTVVDSLPTSLLATSAGGTGWSCLIAGDMESVTCTRSDALAAGSTYPTITVNTNVTSGTSGNIANTATVAGGGDGNLSNNSSTATVPSTQSADLSLTKTASASTINVGDQVTFTLTATNNGPSDATSVSITDPMPNGYLYVSSTQPSNGQACAIAPMSGTLSCQVGTLTAHQSATATITVTALPSASGTNVTNTASVAAQQTDPNAANNTASAVVAVTGADMGITKTVDNNPSSLGTGSTVGYTIVATNNGPSDTTGVTVTDPLPSDLSYVSSTVSDPNAHCSVANGTLTCTDPSLANGASITVHLTGTVISGAAGATLDNTASVSSALADPNLNNNQATVSTPLQADADLSTTKTASESPATPGTDETYTITVSNAGPDTAAGTTVSDTLPSSLTYVSSSNGCSLSGSTVTCTIGSLTSGASAVEKITALVNSSATGSIENSATASSTTPDPDPSNNTGTVSTTVVDSADLSFTKTVDNANPAQGSTITYTLTTTNNGLATAKATTITDALPAGVTYVSDDDNCTLTGTTLTCPVGDLANGQSATVHVKATVNPVTTAHPGQTLNLDVQKVDDSFSVQAGDTQTVSASCPSGYVLTDGSAEISAVDQGTGTLGSAIVQQAYSSGLGTFTAVIINNATGQAQGHVTGVCITNQTSNGSQSGVASQLGVSGLVQDTQQYLAGEHSDTLSCGSGQKVIDPGWQFSDDGTTVRESKPSADGSSWTFTVDVPEQNTAVFSIRCMNDDVSDGQGDLNPLQFTTQTVTQSIPPSGNGGSAYTSVSVTCPTGYKGIVAGWSLDPGLLMIGDDPQPITRVFELYNPTNQSLNATLTLLCVATTTGPEVTQATVTNTASTSSTTEDPNPANNSASATFTANGEILNTVAPSTPSTNASPSTGSSGGSTGSSGGSTGTGGGSTTTNQVVVANAGVIKSGSVTATTGAKAHVVVSLTCTHVGGCAGTAEIVTIDKVKIGRQVVRASTVIGSATYKVAKGKTLKLTIAIKKDKALVGRVKTLGLALKGHNAKRFGAVRHMHVSIAKPAATKKK